MAMASCNPATLYVCICASGGSGAYPKGLYRTTDAGSSWTNVHAFDSCVRVRVDPKDPRHLYVGDGVAGGTHGFWVSTDGGDTWSIPAGFNTAAKAVNQWDVYHVETDPTDFDHVLLTFHNPWSTVDGAAGVFESTDGGSTWSIHPPRNEWAWAYGYNVFFLYNPALGIGDSKTWLYGTQGKGYWRTTDAGTTWAQVSTTNMDHGGGEIYYTKTGDLYASGAPDVLRSRDNGVTWTAITPAPFAAFLSIVGDGSSLYTAGHGGGKFVTSPESVGSTWKPYGGDPAMFSSAGPFEMVVDRANGILYSAHTGAGVWALKVGP
jgi:photosystem II stability/assembly factor-like uncharacterized protein